MARIVRYFLEFFSERVIVKDLFAPMHYSQNEPEGFTLIELLVTMTIITILSGLLAAAVRHAKESANTMVCMSNMRQLNLAFRLYTEDNEETLPYPHASYAGTDMHPEFCWFNAIDSYLLGGMAATNKQSEKAHLIKQDPVIKTLSATWFTNSHTLKMNQRLGEDESGGQRFSKLARFSNPALTVLLFDGRAETEKLKSGGPAVIAKNAHGTEGYVARRHSDRANVLFLDGHVELRKEKVQKGGGLGWALDETRLIWKPWMSPKAP
jgi:prepilin-type processing-associated H-X9-DG protein/prepilin-type N-terminal cleavage/methylation domain-containing protein